MGSNFFVIVSLSSGDARMREGVKEKRREERCQETEIPLPSVLVSFSSRVRVFRCHCLFNSSFRAHLLSGFFSFFIAGRGHIASGGLMKVRRSAQERNTYQRMQGANMKASPRPKFTRRKDRRERYYRPHLP